MPTEFPELEKTEICADDLVSLNNFLAKWHANVAFQNMRAAGRTSRQIAKKAVKILEKHEETELAAKVHEHSEYAVEVFNQVKLIKKDLLQADGVTLNRLQYITRLHEDIIDSAEQAAEVARPVLDEKLNDKQKAKLEEKLQSVHDRFKAAEYHMVMAIYLFEQAHGSE